MCVIQSYGGFVASHAVANETDVFPCGISGAALSDRRYYGNCLLTFQTFGKCGGFMLHFSTKTICKQSTRFSY